MCLIGLAADLPGPWLLVVAANRDEFHDRHTAPAAYWGSTPNGLLAGRDLQGGGTWLGMRRVPDGGSIRIAALTNLRPGLMPAPPVDLPGQPAVPPSRGQLVANFLRTSAEPEVFLRDLDPPAAAYAGFNLLALRLATVQAGGTAAATGNASGNASHAARNAADAVPGLDAWYLNNLPGAPARRLGTGVHLVSNATLDVAWPKTTLLHGALTEALSGMHDSAQLCARLFDALADRSLAVDAELPQTGLDHARERMLSAPFIVDDHYGTRCSTVIIVSRTGDVLFSERSFGPAGQPLGRFTERFSLV